MNKLTRETILQLARQAHMADQKFLSHRLWEAARFVDQHGRETNTGGPPVTILPENINRVHNSMLWDTEGVVS